jgi:hypothetical protein
MSYCTNAADDGRSFPFVGENRIRLVLKDTNIADREKDALLRGERASVADYYNWLFDREQERKTCQASKTIPSSSAVPTT